MSFFLPVFEEQTLIHPLRDKGMLVNFGGLGLRLYCLAHRPDIFYINEGLVPYA